MSVTIDIVSPPLPLSRQQMTVAEYLSFETTSLAKHEYVNGEVREMAGASLEHSAIATDTRTILAINLRNTGCEVYDSDLRVQAEDGGPYYYPDATIVCGAPERDRQECLRNPYAIVEVLSDSTATIDREEKYRAYQRIASLRHYLLIAQAVVRVEHFERLPGNLWALVGEHARLADNLVFAELNLAIPLAEIYRRVNVPEP